jgi:MFS family permease
MLVAVAAFYFPGVLAVIHPRAAGFTVLIFSLLVALLLFVWRERSGAPVRRRAWWAPLAILALFALWANLHGGFIAGFLLLGLATVGLAIDHWRGIPGSVPLSRVAALGIVAVLAAVIVTVATPLGAAIWSYLLSFQNQAISLASTEWESAFSSPLAVIYLSLATCFAAWMWVRSPRPRRVTTLLVTAGFLVFAGYSIRNVVFIGPVLALQVAWTAPNRSHTSLRMPVALVGAAAAAALTLAAFLGPARDDPTLGFPVADYAIAHPPERGRIVTYAGVGSYINWRSPSTPVVLNGWLEQYTPQELRDNYGILRAWTRDLPGALKRTHAGAVITHVQSAIRQLEAMGFRPRFTSAQGTYLVRVPHKAALSGP